MFAYPGNKCRFVNLTRCERLHGERGVGLRCRQAIAIKREKQTCRQKCGTLIAIDKRMILGQTKSVGCGQFCMIGLTVDGEILCARQGGIEQSCIPQSSRAAMFSQTFLMQ